MTSPLRVAPEACARAVCEKRHPDARVVFLAGSVMRGEATRFSDLDLVVVYERLHHAYRESFMAHEWPVETFVHDPETLNYFLSTDRAKGIPTLASMIVDGIALPSPSEFADSLKSLATRELGAGPPCWSKEERDFSRYMITDLVEDLRAPRSRAELHAGAARLYEMLANHYCRSRGLWSARGKAIVRRLQQIDHSFAAAYTQAFAAAFEHGNVTSLVSIRDEVLQAEGGALFDGYRVDAPHDWRLA
ncbi:MAG TPA: nucleotidyltransferase domain-containing protein [Steroidobacteraceae bacterium]|nr:nucleotidyltransferase domain-containing protein [Steroidobacteraceae bacterium]